MTGAQWVLAGTVFFSGLASGLLGMLCTIMRPMLAELDGPEFRGSTAFVLTAIGLAVVLAGVIVVSNVWKTPHYKVMLAWDPERMPRDWESGRDKYFAINWLQLVATWCAFGLFVAALIAL